MSKNVLTPINKVLFFDLFEDETFRLCIIKHVDTLNQKRRHFQLNKTKNYGETSRKNMMCFILLQCDTFEDILRNNGRVTM